jgi:hypothetical protein
MRFMRRPPTDFQLLREIYDRHHDEYRSYLEEAGARESKILVPIDIPAIANKLRVDVDSVFGRLYYHLDSMYGQERDKTAGRKVFFTPVAGDERNCVNFPLLEAVLAGLWQQRRRDLSTFWVAVVSVGIAVGSLVVSIVVAATT